METSTATNNGSCRETSGCGSADTYNGITTNKMLLPMASPMRASDKAQTKRLAPMRSQKLIILQIPALQ
jgi:hypothetical protein